MAGIRRRGGSALSCVPDPCMGTGPAPCAHNRLECGDPSLGIALGRFGRSLFSNPDRSANPRSAAPSIERIFDLCHGDGGTLPDAALHIWGAGPVVLPERLYGCLCNFPVV